MKPHLPLTAAAAATTAVVGGLGTDVDSPWYEALDKPAWQPPGWVFGPAWTTLYGLIAVAAARTLDRSAPRDRGGYTIALGTNLVLNAGWSWLFFTAQRPRLALVEVVVLEASTVELLRRSARVDPVAGRLLAPYAAWVGFATALTGAIARRNR